MFRYLLALLVATGLGACASIPDMNDQFKPPKADPADVTVEKPSLDSEKLKAQIESIALSSDCAKSAHDNQGKPPQGYMRGIALSYARALCNQGSEAFKIASQSLGDASKDALAHYGAQPKDATERLQMLYSLMIGSAARESSWRWCVGKDPGASNTTAETCETGLYQTSYNSRSASPVLPKLYEQFKASKRGCFSTEYKGATTCSADNMKNWGSGEGVEFQRLTKDCPGFATEYHAVMLRVNRKHYGPINTKKALLKPVCTAMFEKVRQAVVANPFVCPAL